MFGSNNLLWSLLVLLPCWSAAQSSFPAIVEVDLIFPRNDTYAPTPLMPVVFAIQNPQIAVPLDLTLEWTVIPIPVDSSNKSGGDGFTYYGTQNSSNNPYFGWSSLYNITTSEGTWVFDWTLSAVNCTQFPRDTYFEGTPIIFTIKNGAKMPDLIPTTGNDTCTGMEGFAFNVTEFSTPPVIGGSPSTCAVVASTSPTPTPNPCAAQLNATGASSISAALTRSFCATQLPSHTPLISCPPTNGASIGVLFRGTIWLPATFGWLLYTIVL